MDMAVVAAERYLGYYAEVRRIHEELTGVPLENYKMTEPECVVGIFRQALDSDAEGTAFIGDLLHELAWGQCLSNGNHRTALMFVKIFLDRIDISFPWYADEEGSHQRFQSAVNEYTDRSKAIMKRRGAWGYPQRDLEPRHREHTHRWIEVQLGNQSLVPTMVGPQALKTFLS